MPENRRNYYRVLHVQPEAPQEVIKASYRTLMSTLRQHPDLGGDTATAAVLNEAYAVLSDPQRRAAYDRALVAQWQQDKARETAKSMAAKAAKAATEAAAMASPAGEPSVQIIGPGCPICHTALPTRIQADTRCTHCAAPLAALPAFDRAAHELFGRRGSARRDRTQVATLLVGWPATRLPVRWRDLSLTGLSLYCAQPLVAGQTMRVVDSALDAVAQVVSCRAGMRTAAGERIHTLHARLLTAIFTQTAGVFVSAKA